MGGWLRITLIIRLSQPSLAGVGAGAELGNKKATSKCLGFDLIVISLVKNLYGNKVGMHYEVGMDLV